MPEKIEPWILFMVGPFRRIYKCPDCQHLIEPSTAGVPAHCPFCGRLRRKADETFHSWQLVVRDIDVPFNGYDCPDCHGRIWIWEKKDPVSEHYRFCPHCGAERIPNGPAN